LVTSAVVIFVYQARPEILNAAQQVVPIDKVNMKKVILGLAFAAAVTGGSLSWFASSNPDGLEWSMFRTSGKEELESREKVHSTLASVQKKTAFLPDYGFKKSEAQQALEAAAASEIKTGSAAEAKQPWPAVDAGTSVAGLVGGILTLALAFLIGFALKRRKPVV
jgi:cobalt/nickel transport system permease protein